MLCPIINTHLLIHTLKCRVTRTSNNLFKKLNSAKNTTTSVRKKTKEFAYQKAMLDAISGKRWNMVNKLQLQTPDRDHPMPATLFNTYRTACDILNGYKYLPEETQTEKLETFLHSTHDWHSPPQTESVLIAFKHHPDILKNLSVDTRFRINNALQKLKQDNVMTFLDNIIAEFDTDFDSPQSPRHPVQIQQKHTGKRQ